MAQPFEVQPQAMGSFLSEKFEVPPRNPQVGRIQKQDTLHKKHGQIDINDITLQNGDRYTVFSTLPNNPVTDLTMNSSTAWLTGIEHGHNMRTMHRFLREGVPMDFVSIEQNRNVFRAFNLTRSAANLLEIHRATAEHYNRGLKPSDDMVRDPTNIILSGISQGGMKALGATAIANQPESDINVVHADIIGPCCADKTRLLPDITHPDELLELGRQEASSIAKLFQLPLSMLIRYPGTLSRSPQNLLRNLHDQTELRSGVTGSYPAAISHEQSGHLTWLAGDTWLGQGKTFEQRFADHPNFITERVEAGGHLGVILDEISDAHRERVLDAISGHHISSVGLRNVNNL